MYNNVMGVTDIQQHDIPPPFQAKCILDRLPGDTHKAIYSSYASITTILGPTSAELLSIANNFTFGVKATIITATSINAVLYYYILINGIHVIYAA